jgi:hypothetical protein
MAGASFFAAPAQAVGALTVSPGSATLSTINLADQAVTMGTGFDLPQRLSDAALALRVTSAITTTASSLQLSVDSYTPPTGQTVTGQYLYYTEMTAGGTAGPAPAGSGNGPWKRVAAPTGGAVANTAALVGTAAVATKDVFLATNKPGTYTFHFVDPGTAPGTDDDVSSATFSLNVLDAYGTTSGTTADDWSPVITNDVSTAGVGAPVVGHVGLADLSLSDVRGSSSGSGILGGKLAALVGIGFTGAGTQAAAAGTFASTHTTKLLPVASTAAGTLTATAYFDGAGDNTFTGTTPDKTLGTAQTSVVSNNVTGVDLTAPAVVGSIAETTGGATATTNANATATATTLALAANGPASLHRIKISKSGETTEYAVIESGGGSTSLTLAAPLVYAHSSGSTVTDVSAIGVKTGIATVTYAATVTDTDTTKSGNVVYFTLGGTDVASLTTDGTTVDATAHVFSAVTDVDGVARLKVTDSATTRVAYTVAAASNGEIGGTVTSTYADAAAKTFELTSQTYQLYPTIGGSAVVKGKLLDQFGASFQPISSASQQVQVDVDQTYDGTTFSATGGAGGYATITSGEFTFTYLPAVVATAGRRDGFRFIYSPATNYTDSVYWTTSDSPASVTITAPTSTATPAIKAGTATLGSGVTIQGAALNGSNSGLPYKAVVLSGSPGVYFSNVAAPDSASTDDLATQITVPSDASGVYSGYAFFTKPGTATITVTSGTATKSVDVTVSTSSDPYQAVAIDAAFEPGTTGILTGQVKDAFGNGVKDNWVRLSLGTSTIGTLGATEVKTNDDGVWSTTFVAGANSDGQATLTATLCQNAGTSCTAAQTVNKTANSTWLANGGLKIADGFYYDTAKITVDANINKTSLAAPTSRVGSGSVKLTGKAKPGSTVEIYAKLATGSYAYALVGVATADSDGDWTSTEYINGTTMFYAKTTVSSSAAVTVKVTVPPVPPTPKFNLGAKALGSGKVAITAVGNGDSRSSVTIYQVVGKKTVKVTTVKVDNKGVARATIKTSKGSKTYKVVYINGYKNGSKTIKVTVK